MSVRASNSTTLVVLATSDLHGALTPKDSAQGSLANLSSVIADERAKAAVSDDQVLLVDNGDALQGSDVMDWCATSNGLRAEHPVIAAFAELKYDAITLGNHEFDYGMTALSQRIGEATQPVVSCNIAGVDHVVPWTILKRDVTLPSGTTEELRIGITGVCPPETAQWNAARLPETVQFTPIMPALKRSCAELRAAGADVVICLAHIGITADDTPCVRPDGSHVNKNETTLEVLSMSSLDAVILGHTHVSFQTDANAKIPAVLPAAHGAELGKLTLELSHDGKSWQVGNTRATALPAAAQPQKLITPALNNARQRAQNWLDEPIGQSEISFNSALALTMPTPLSNLLGDALIAAAAPFGKGFPVLATVPMLRTGGRTNALNYTHIAAGTLRRRDLIAAYPFQSSLQLVQTTAQALRDDLRKGARIYGDLTKQTQLFNTDVPRFTVNIVHGATYQIHLDAAPDATNRVSPLKIQGITLANDTPLLVATDDYRVQTGKITGTVCEGPEMSLRQTLEAYLTHTTPTQASHGALRPEAWHLEAAKGSNATFNAPRDTPLPANIRPAACQSGTHPQLTTLEMMF